MLESFSVLKIGDTSSYSTVLFFCLFPLTVSLSLDENKSLIPVIGIFVFEQTACVDKENHILSQWNLFLLINKIESIILNHLEGY